MKWDHEIIQIAFWQNQNQNMNILTNKKLVIIHFQAFLSACVQSRGGIVCLTISSLFAPAGSPEWAFWRTGVGIDIYNFCCAMWFLALLGFASPLLLVCFCNSWPNIFLGCGDAGYCDSLYGVAIFQKLHYSWHKRSSSSEGWRFPVDPLKIDQQQWGLDSFVVYQKNSKNQTAPKPIKPN